MTLFDQGNVNPSAIIANAQGKLISLRKALEDCHDLFRWSSGTALTDLEAIGFNASDAQTVLTAIADANALYVLYNTGLPPSTYPQPSSSYQYAASQSLVIGPQ